MKPLISIIMATYNRAHFIEETLLSVQKQTYTEWECLIIDDGGTDNTLNVIQPILKQDQRFQFLKRTDTYKKGLPGCRNYGLDIAKGDYIIFFDDDDIMHPKLIELSLKEITGNDYDFCRYLREAFYGSFNIEFDFNEKYQLFEININDIESIITNQLRFNSCQVLWRKECFKKDRYQENLMYAEEWEFYIRILSNRLKGISIEKVLFYGRKHEMSNTGDFFKGNLVRITSKVEAILLIIKNLKNKQLLTKSMIRFFINTSLGYKNFQLFKQIIEILDLSVYEKFKWNFYFIALPLRLKIFKLKKKLIK